MQAKTISTVADRASGATLSTIAKLVTAAGTVQFEGCTFYFYPGQFTWTRLQGLFNAAQATRADGKHLPPAAAAAAYTNGIESALGMFLALPDSVRLLQFDQLLDAITATGSFAGLASPFLSGLNTAGYSKDHARIQRAAALWAKHGATAHGGTKLTRAYLVDGAALTITPVSASALKALAPGGAKASLMGASAIGHLSLQIQGAAILDTGEAEDGDTCKGILQTAGGIVGGVIGGAASKSWGGAVTGFGAGSTVGGILGNFVCGSSTPTTASPGGGAGGAPAGPSSADQGVDPTSDTGSGPSDEGGSSSASSEQNQSSDQNQSSSQDNSSQSSSQDNSSQTSSQDNSSQSSSQDNSGSGSSGDNSGSGDGHDSGGGMPNPDSPGGIPSPDDPHGFSGFSGSYAVGAGVASFASRASSGAWVCHGAPQLTAAGGLASAGFLSAIPAIAAMAGQKSGVGALQQTQISQVAESMVASGVLAQGVAQAAAQAAANAGREAAP